MPVARPIAATIVCFFILAQHDARAATVTITPKADANFTNGILNVKPPAQYGLVINGIENTSTTLLYDVGAIPPGALIDSLGLRLYQTSFSPFSQQVAIYGFTDRDGILTADDFYGDHGAFGGMGAYLPPNLGTGLHTISVGQGELYSAALDINHHFGLRLVSADPPATSTIAGLEQAPLPPPTLVVTYHNIPEPAALALLMVGACAGVRRRRCR